MTFYAFCVHYDWKKNKQNIYVFIEKGVKHIGVEAILETEKIEGWVTKHHCLENGKVKSFHIEYFIVKYNMLTQCNERLLVPKCCR